MSARAADASNPLCGACLAEAPAFDCARSFGVFTGELRKAILRVKFSHDERLGVHLGRLLIAAWDQLPSLGNGERPLVMPVPLHASRRKERGFNQSDLLAKGLVRELGKRQAAAKLRVLDSILVRAKPTTQQTGLSVAARRENVRGAFEVRKPESIRGRDIVLIDDVMTTGATLSACARALKKAGGRNVWALTLARATPQFPDLTAFPPDNPVDEFGQLSP